MGIDMDVRRRAFVYCGDSPNDEPMFSFFPLSFGMANVREFLPLMKSHPAYITTQPSGAGFAEVARLLIESKSMGSGRQ